MKKLYTVHCPVQEIWEMQVEANSPEDALKRVRSGEGHQTCSFAGTTKSGRDEVVRVDLIEND